jgi:tetratricopeptide (TPR) repeat protein
MVFTFLFLYFFPDTIILQQGDEHFIAQDYFGAINMYQSHLKNHPNDAEAYWRMVRATICAGDISKPDEQEQYYRNAVQLSKTALQLDSANSNVQCWYAVSLGYIAIFEGSKKKVELCHQIQKALEISIALDPRNDIAYSIYGTFYRALGNVNWLERHLANLLLGGLPNGGYAEAETMLLKAIDIAPNILRHRYELGLLYFEWGKNEKGKAVFKSALKLPQTLASDQIRIKDMKEKLLN